MATDKPAAVFNLDGFKAEGELKPFPVNFKGKLYNMVHLDNLDGFDTIDAFMLNDAGSTKEVLKMALGDDHAEFRKGKPSKAMLDELVKRYLAHCGVDTGKLDG